MTRRIVVLVIALVGIALAEACYKPPPEVLSLKGGTLTVYNPGKQDWSNVDVWLNTFYRAQFSSVPAGGRMLAPLNFFIAGLGQRFSFEHMQVKSLRLTAKLPDGSPFEVNKEFEGDGLAGVAKGMGKKK